jgi:hypothetical protein
MVEVAGAGDKAKRGLAVLKGFMDGVKVSLGGLEIALDIDPEKGAADSGDLESDLPNLFVAVAEAAGEVLGDGPADAGGVDRAEAGAAKSVGEDGLLFGKRYLVEDDAYCSWRITPAAAASRTGIGHIYHASKKGGSPGGNRR